MKNPPTSAGAVLPAGVATTGVALMIVIIRILTRKFVVKGNLGVDDCEFLFCHFCKMDTLIRIDLCIASLIFSFGFLAMAMMRMWILVWLGDYPFI